MTEVGELEGWVETMGNIVWNTGWVRVEKKTEERGHHHSLL